MASGKRNILMDALKALAIILVVIGHVLVLYHPDDYSEDMLFKICYSFHMPLFIFISGWLDGLRDNRYFDKAWIGKRTKRLLWPYAVWTLIAFLISKAEGTGDRSLLNYLFVEPAVWFLINLWIYSAMLFISAKFKHWIAVFSIQCIVFAGLYLMFRDANLVVKNVVLFFPFFIGGVVLRRIIPENMECFYSRKIFCMIPFVLYPLSMALFFYRNYPPHIVRIQEFLNITGHSFLIHAALMFYNHIIVAALGIWFAWALVKIMVNHLERAGSEQPHEESDRVRATVDKACHTSGSLETGYGQENHRNRLGGFNITSWIHNRALGRRVLSFIQYVGGEPCRSMFYTVTLCLICRQSSIIFTQQRL